MIRTDSDMEMIGEDRSTGYFKLSLFVTGASPNSVKAITNIRKVCNEYLIGRYELEIIDVYQQPGIASKEQIIAIPMLIKRGPEPLRRLIGDMSDTSKVLESLGITKTG